MSDKQDLEVVEAWLRSRLEDECMGDLVVLALGRAIARDDAFFTVVHKEPDADGRRESSRRFDSEAASYFQGPISHVVDWLTAAVLDDEPWLKRVDAEGRPLKLLKIGSLDRAVREADKAMKRGLSHGTASEPGAGEKTFAELDDGWSIVELLTPEALDRESSRMQHCIGQGAYDAALEKGRSRFLSLRDPNDRPHVTVELETYRSYALQIEGKQNKPPIDRHLLRMMPLLERIEVSYSIATGMGLVINGNGVHHPTALPDELVVGEDLVMDMREREWRMPAEMLSALGSIRIVAPIGTTVVLPKILVAGHAIVLEGDFVFREGAQVSAASLKLVSGTFSNIPEKADLKDGLTLENAMIGRLPPGFAARMTRIVGGDLATVPAGFRFSSLELDDVPFDSLPEGLVVRTLNISGGSISSIGRCSAIGQMFLKNCPQPKIPDDLRLDRLVVDGVDVIRPVVGLIVTSCPPDAPDDDGCSISPAF